MQHSCLACMDMTNVHTCKPNEETHPFFKLIKSFLKQNKWMDLGVTEREAVLVIYCYLNSGGDNHDFDTLCEEYLNGVGRKMNDGMTYYWRSIRNSYVDWYKKQVKGFLDATK